MFTAADFTHKLNSLGSTFFTGVPDTVLQNLCNHLNSHSPSHSHIQTTNEGNAIALAAGHHLATGNIPVVYMQNSGIGNAVNPLMSLAHNAVYALPILLLVGWRGEPGLKDEPQHEKQGHLSPALFNAMEIPQGIISPDWNETVKELEKAYQTMRATPGPYALLVRNGCFDKVPPVDGAGYGETGLLREQAIEMIIDNTDKNAAFVASTGMGPRELYELRETRGESHEHDFLNAGAMGHASMIALGVAEAQPDRRVVCLDGDGALLMHLGALPVIAASGRKKFTHFLLNNGVHDSVGGQPNLAMQVELSALAAECGYEKVFTISSADELRETLPEIYAADGPVFVEIRIARGFRKDLGRPGIPFATAARQFRDFLTGSEKC